MPNASRLASAAPAGARRFRPRLVPTVATVAALVLFVAAGNWQRGRMETKEALRAQLDAAARSAPIDADALPSATDWAALRYRNVTAAGEFDRRHQILIDNRVHAGRVGYDVVAPLRMVDGRIVLVARGWVAQGATRDVLPDAPPPAGTVTISGRLAIPPAGYLELSAESSPGTVWQNLDPGRFAATTGLAVLPAVIEQTSPADDGLVRDWPAPDFGIEKHRIYMWQWYAFAVLAVVLWFALNLRHTRRDDDE